MRHLFTITTFLIILFSNFSFGQFEKTHSRVFITPEIGMTFSDADVTTRYTAGIGLKLGYTIAKYRAVEFDIRGRWFYGSWRGQNRHNSDLSNYNGDVDNYIYSDYQNTLGYVVRNFQTSNHNLALEGLLRFNVDKNRKWAPYIFGGIAGSFYKTRGNLFDKDGFTYNYQPNFVPESNKEYDKILDKTYETSLNKGMWSATTTNIGIGFSYNINDGVRIGLEHTMSFTNKDNFDGYVANKSFTKNDVYHFTSFYAQFYLRGGHTKDKTKTPPSNETTQTPCTPPTIRFYNPARSGDLTEDESYEFFATVNNITDKNNIDVTVNGRQIYDFKFNPKNGRISTFETLNFGINTITISARNACGSDQQTTTVNFQRRNPQPPVVYFTNPATNPYNTTENRFNLAAKIFYVANSQNVVFKQNGVVNANFSFNPTNNDFNSYVVLQNGNNIFEITGTNPDGTAVATTVIIVGRKVECQSPVISIKQPARAPAYTNTADYTIIGSIYNATSRDQITVSVNGKSFTNFTFNVNDKTISARVMLQKGTNTILIRATNTCGTTDQTVSITYTPVEQTQPNPPTVTYINPYQSNTSVSTATYNFVATTTYITAANQINVTLNGVKVTNFSFNPTTQQITFNASLIEGYNTAIVNVANQDGNASATTTVLYRKAVSAPTVHFTNPPTSPTTVTSNNYNLVAKSVNVSAKNQVNFYVNGTKTTLFAFNPSSGEITYTSVLREGSNEFKVEVKTDGGAASDETVIIYQKRTVVETPTVKFTSPSTSIEVKSPTYNLAAITSNVDESKHITITRNGTVITNFTFNVASQEVRFASNLDEGDNLFKITVNTEGGYAEDALTIKYNKEVIIPAPTVVWTAPAKPGSSTVISAYDFVAKTTNIQDRNKISVYLNNNLTTNFTFNVSTGIISFRGNLNAGNNTAVVQVNNESGSASDATSIIYRPLTVVECNKPTLKITDKNPSTPVAKTYSLSGSVTEITNAQNLSVFVNGKQVTNPINYANKQFNVAFEFTAGTYVIEVKATNNCGTTSEYTTVTVESCKTPEVIILSPNERINLTKNTTATVQFGITNITAKNQISVSVNGKSQDFTYDAVNSRVSLVANLIVGANKIELIAQNDCGGSSKSVNITRTECNKPTLSVQNSSVQNNATTTNPYFSLTAITGYISENSQINVTVNGKAVNFVFNPSTNTLNLDVSSAIGLNTIIIKLTNPCGTISYTHTFTRQEDPNAKPPTLTFVTPASATTVEEATFNFVVNSKYVTAKSQLAVKVNGQSVWFNFNEATGSITFSSNLNEGANTATVYAVTNYGSDEKSAVVTYKKKVVTPTPEIVITSHACPIQLFAGNNTISGYVINVNSPNDVKFYLDNSQLSNVVTTFSNGKVSFSYTIMVRSTNTSQTLKIVANNAEKTATKNCVMNSPSNTNTGGNNGSTNPITPPRNTNKGTINSEEIKITIPTNTTPENGNTRPTNPTGNGINRGNVNRENLNIKP
jgi:hypothetical protein